jgi:ferrochelatase
VAIPNSSSDGLILVAHGTPNVLGEMDIYLKLVTGGRGVSPEVVHELQERYAQIGLGDERSAESPTLLAGH